MLRPLINFSKFGDLEKKNKKREDLELYSSI